MFRPLIACKVQKIMSTVTSTNFRMHSTSGKRRNHFVNAHFKDSLIEWIKDMLSHSFVLNAMEGYADTMSNFEELVEEHRADPVRSRLKQYVPTIGTFFTPLPMRQAFEVYDRKYAVSKRRHLPPTFNEVRHMLNLAQVLALSQTLSLITFDGDQTLYTDGSNFEDNEELARSIVALLKSGVRCAVVTAAGYGLNGPKYEIRLRGLLDRFISYNLTAEEVERFFVLGGECNYLLMCKLSETEPKKAVLTPITPEVWQAPELNGPRPSFWPEEQVKQLMDIAEKSMRDSIQDLRLRAKLLRKDRATGIYPGGDEMVDVYPHGHGHIKLKREALDEIVFRVMEDIRYADPPVTIPFCVFNGGRDAWVDVGNKRVGVEALQAFLKVEPQGTLHVGDQFLFTGNDVAARETCPCIWINSPRETEKILEHLLRFMKITAPPLCSVEQGDQKVKFDVYTGEPIKK